MFEIYFHVSKLFTSRFTFQELCTNLRILSVPMNLNKNVKSGFKLQLKLLMTQRCALQRTWSLVSRTFVQMNHLQILLLLVIHYPSSMPTHEDILDIGYTHTLLCVCVCVCVCVTEDIVIHPNKCIYILFFTDNTEHWMPTLLQYSSMGYYTPYGLCMLSQIKFFNQLFLPFYSNTHHGC